MTLFATINPETGQLYPDVVPLGSGGGGVSGGEQFFSWGIAGPLAVHGGEFFQPTPLRTIEFVRARFVLGTLPTVGTSTPTVARVMLNGAPLVEFSLADGVRMQERNSGSFAQATSGPGNLLSVDIVGVPNSTPAKAGNAVIQVWWRYTS